MMNIIFLMLMQKLLAQELEDRDYYREVNAFWVPEAARWESLACAKQNKLILESLLMMRSR